MEAQTKEIQDKMTPDKSLNELKLGNQRFVNKNQLNRDLLQQVKETSTGHTAEQNGYCTKSDKLDTTSASELSSVLKMTLRAESEVESSLKVTEVFPDNFNFESFV